MNKKLALALVVLLSLATCSQADHRRRFQELAFQALGSTERWRGGVTAYCMSAIQGEQDSHERLKQEGYDPSFGLRHKTKVWSYNCQMANNNRIRMWAQEWQDCFVLLQGTSRAYDETKGEKTLQLWHTDTHDVFEAKVAKKTRGGPQPEGVMLMAPKGMHKIVKKVMVPTAKDIEGRAIAVWFSSCLLYTSPSPRD